MTYRRLRRSFLVAGAVALAVGVPSLPSVPAGAACPIPIPAQPPGGVDCPEGGVYAPAPGYIAIRQHSAANMPFAYSLAGGFADANLFTCSAATLAGGEFKVTCVPQPNGTITWRCAVLHADASTFTSGGRARATLDCDGQAPFEAQTAVANGAGGHDTEWTPSGVSVTEFSCTLDGGTAPWSPDFVVGCGDPGLIEVR